MQARTAPIAPPGPTAFVLAGGGSLGAIEVGMLRELLAWGVRPDFVVGASAGAINGAFFAGAPTLEGVGRLEAIWSGLRRHDVLPCSVAGLLRGLITRKPHLIDSAGLRRLLAHHLPCARLEDAPLPVHIVASDMHTGHEVLLSRGAAVDAVLASAAIPGVFPPVRIGERWLVDGGVANNTPISTAVRLGARRVIVLSAGFAHTAQQLPAGALGRAMHALALVVARQLQHDAERFAGLVDLRIVPSPPRGRCSAYDYSNARGLIESGASATRGWLEWGGLGPRGGAAAADGDDARTVQIGRPRGPAPRTGARPVQASRWPRGATA
ncbi:MAG: patatin-like phospholipase family protein [Pseudomonas sp.]